MGLQEIHIQLNQVHGGYNTKIVLRDINLEIHRGEALSLIGRSGCGKTTLLHIISGMYKAHSGQVIINGDNISKPSAQRVMMYQQPHLYPWMTVLENASLGLKFAGLAKKQRQRVLDLLKLVELDDFLETNVQNLSGGQQQRVALARSLALQPELLLLDEPFSALDTFTRTSLQNQVRIITKELGITLIVVTHSLEEALLMSDRVLIMEGNPGKIVHEVEVNLTDRNDTNSKDFIRQRDDLLEKFENMTQLRIYRPLKFL